MLASHPWMLTGPWYRWAAPEELRAAGKKVHELGRSSRPEIQKYAGFDFAAEFLREPQRSVRWKDEDYFHRTVINPQVLPANLAVLLATEADVDTAVAIVDRTSTLSSTDQRAFIDEHFAGFTDAAQAKSVLVDEGSSQFIPGVSARRRWVLQEIVDRPEHAPAMGTWLREKTQIRKLYRATHARNYLVVIELHCDVPGLPSVSRDQVEEAGFVVRRLRVRSETPQVAAAATAALQQVAMAREKIQFLERNAKGRIRSAQGLQLQRWFERPVIKKQRDLLGEWAEGKLKLDELAAARAFSLETQAWIPHPDDPMRGTWTDLSDAAPPLDLSGEGWTPLYPLIPDPAARDHSEAGRTAYFGVIPTGSREAEADGAARFDERHLYEIRCFVRKRHPKPGCRGPLVWSEPTIGYRLAPEADPEGSANLPVTIKVPSFRDVKAYADRLATGGAGGMRIEQPPDSVMPIIGDFPDVEAGEKSGLGQICFIAILLLFLIALFLMFLFLPVIVLLFQLFFLLRLKFCIPPSIELDLDLAVEIKAELDVQFAIGAEVSAQASFAISESFMTWFEDNNGGQSLEDWADEQLEVYFAKQEKMKEAMLALSLPAKLQRILDLGTDFRGSLDPEVIEALHLSEDGQPPSDPPLPAPLPVPESPVYYSRIEPSEVFG